MFIPDQFYKVYYGSQLTVTVIRMKKLIRHKSDLLLSISISRFENIFFKRPGGVGLVARRIVIGDNNNLSSLLALGDSDS